MRAGNLRPTGLPACAHSPLRSYSPVMKLDSKYFDSIRVAPKREGPLQAEVEHPPCQWKGCTRWLAPRAQGRGREGQYYYFCVDHVRQFNASYNYFDGMSDTEVKAFQKDAVTGHRPTWKVGANAATPGSRDDPARAHPGAPAARGCAIRTSSSPGARKAREEPVESRRQLRPLERKSLEALDLAEGAARDEIKARFKELVKRHHPDANGGDTRSEDRLRQIIQAYNYLKQAGLA